MFEKLNELFKSNSEAHEYQIEVGGMKCENCVKKITELLSKMPGIEKVAASLKDGKIDIVSSIPVVKETVEKLVNNAGFDFKGLIEKK